MNPTRQTTALAAWCTSGLLLGISACAPTQPTLNSDALATAPPLRTVQHVNLSTDAYFDFGQADLSPDGKAKLDLLVAEMAGKQDPHLQVTGYADRLGNEQYNQQLAQRRAEAVRDYLISKGVAATLIDTTVLGTRDPIVDCAGKSGQALIQCLGPNRRTVVEFSAFEIVDEAAQPQE